MFVAVVLLWCWALGGFLQPSTSRRMCQIGRTKKKVSKLSPNMRFSTARKLMKFLVLLWVGCQPPQYKRQKWDRDFWDLARTWKNKRLIKLKWNILLLMDERKNDREPCSRRYGRENDIIMKFNISHYDTLCVEQNEISFWCWDFCRKKKSSSFCCSSTQPAAQAQVSFTSLFVQECIIPSENVNILRH